VFRVKKRLMLQYHFGAEMYSVLTVGEIVEVEMTTRKGSHSWWTNCDTSR